MIQRFGGGLNTNPHFHTLVLDGVLSEAQLGALEFHAAPQPSDAEVAHVLSMVDARVQRLLVRRGLAPEDDEAEAPDLLAEKSPTLAGIVSASVQGRVALGPRAGARMHRMGPDRDGGAVTSRGPRQAQLKGFDLHANVRVPATDRAGLERLCRYILRPPLADDRLRLRADGRVQVDLKTVWHDGTTQLVFKPIELLENRPAPVVSLVARGPTSSSKYSLPATGNPCGPGGQRRPSGGLAQTHF